MAISEQDIITTTPLHFGDIFPHVENILHCGIYAYNFRTRQCTWSEGIYKIFGLVPNGQPASLENFLLTVETEERELVQKKIAAAQSDPGCTNFEFSIRDSRGNFKRLYTERIIRSNQTDPDLFEGLLKDITDNYLYRQALEQKVQQLDKSNQNLQEFVYIASHDLQEPLRKISTFTGRLESRFQKDLPEDGQNYLTRILNATHNMQRLLEDLLAFSRLSFEEKTATRVNLNECLKLALSDLELKIEESGAILETEDLPDILGHPHQIKQLFLNLLGNALKFRTTESTPKIIIQTESTKSPILPDGTKLSGNFFVLRIEDNGIGFEPVFAEKIFTIFQRLNGKSEYAGSGIGLAICRKIIEQHGGKIYATGEAGKGAKFTILLPDNNLTSC